MTSIEFTVPGKVDTNHRPRASLRGGRIRTHKAAGYRGYVARVDALAFHAFDFDATRWRDDARYTVTITIHEHDRRSRDLDNVAKGILDGISGHAWQDDRQVDALHVIRGEVRRTAPCVIVKVEVIEEAER